MTTVRTALGSLGFQDPAGVSSRFGGSFVDEAELTALPEKSRAHGMVAVTMDGPKLWFFDVDSAETPSATILACDAGDGQWIQILVPLDDVTVMNLLASTANGDGASLIGVEDADGVIAATTVEGALEEIGAVQIRRAKLSVGHADLTDADAQQAIDFAAALPATAFVLGGYANVTAIFDNVGDTASVTFDLGFSGGDTDALIDAGSLNAVARVSTPQGVFVPKFMGAITPSVIFDGSVNLDTLTKGAADFYVLYFETDSLE